MSGSVKHILFPTDFSEAAQLAFVHALMLARSFDARITLLHVIYPEYEALDLPVMAAKATQEKIEAARAALEGFQGLGRGKWKEMGLKEAFPEITVDTEVGGAIHVINHVARRDQVDLIVMGRRGEHNAIERAFGSVSTGVMERASCPVWLVPESAPFHRPSSVLYATGFEEPGPKPVRHAAGMLAPFKPKFHVAHVRKAGMDVEPADFSAWGAELEQEIGLSSVQFHDRLGESVGEALDGLVEELKAELLIMYGPHHNLLERIFGISQTRQMARRTEIPLLIIKD